MVSYDYCAFTQSQSGLVGIETAAKCEAYSDSVFLCLMKACPLFIWRQVSETDREREREKERKRKKIERLATAALQKSRPHSTFQLTRRESDCHSQQTELIHDRALKLVEHMAALQMIHHVKECTTTPIVSSFSGIIDKAV